MRILAAALCCAALLGFASPAQANMSYFGGPIMHANTTVLVDWGSSVSSTYTSGDPGFLQALAGQIGSPANVSGILAQYLDTSGQNYSAAGYDSQRAITPSTSSTSITDAQIRSELKAQVGAGHLPAPSGDGLATLYVVLFPGGTQVCLSPGSCSGTAFCAYHSSTSLNGSTRILYAVMPDMTSVSGCQQSGNSAFQSHTVVLSHEWAEAINDPLVSEAGSFGPPLAWYDSSSGDGEIGDLCNQQSATNGSYRVQREWSNLDGGCVSTESLYSQPTAAFTAPSGVTPGAAASFSGAGSSDPSGNHASVTYGGQTHTIPSGIASWSWSWDDGSPASSGVSPSHTFTAAGTYNVTLTVRDNLGFTGAVTHPVAVGAPAPPPAAPSPPPAASAQPVLPASLAPKLTFAGSSKPKSLSRALAHGLRLRFSCDRACTVSFNLTFQLPPAVARAVTAVILARGSATLKSAGSGVVVLKFNRSGRKALKHKRRAKLILTGFARDSAGHASAPSQVKLVLRR